MIGGTIQNYRIVRELGAGAMGAVYEGVDTLVERPVAIKMLRAEIAKQPELIERFRGEAIALGRLLHPNIAMLYNFFREGEDYYMVMEMVSGQSLEKIIEQAGRLALPDAAHLMGQVLDGLGYAHSMSILHRDVKPANILVTGDGRVKVTDFGIARVLGSSRMTRSGRIIGTLEYIAPERIKGDESDLRSDLYSAGIVLYEMITGKLPFAGTTDYDLIKAQLEQEPPTLSTVLQTQIPEEWENVVRCAMAKSPNERFQNAQAFHNALPRVASPQAAQASVSARVKATRMATVAEEQAPEAAAAPMAEAASAPVPPTVQAATASTTTAPPKKRPAALWIAIAAVIVIVLAVVGVVLARKGGGGTQPAANPTPVVVTPPQPVQPQPTPQDESWKKNPGAITIGTNPSKGSQGPAAGTSKKQQTEAERRKAALRALGGDDTGTGKTDKNDTKRKDALRALDH